MFETTSQNVNIGESCSAFIDYIDCWSLKIKKMDSKLIERC